MRAHALHIGKASIAEVLYPQGSIVVCRSCGKPLYRLARSIYARENAGTPALRDKFVPVQMRDLRELMDRSDLEPGQRAAIKAMSREDQFLHCCKVQPIPAGGGDTCPACGAAWTFARATNDAEGASRFNGREYVISLAIIPPQGLARRVR